MATYDWGSILGGLFNVGGLSAAAYLPYENAGQTMQDIQAATEAFQTGASNLGTTATSGLEFTPFSVTGGAGTATFDPTGGMTTQLSPEYQQLASMMQNQALQTGQYSPYNLSGLQSFGTGALTGAQTALGGYNNPYLSAISQNYLQSAMQMPQQIDTSFAEQLGQGMLGASSGLLGQSLTSDPYLQSMQQQSLQNAQAQQASAMGIDPSQYQALQNQALFQAQQGLATGGPTQSELFEQMQQARAGVQDRQRLELENRLAAQGRLGVQTAAYGGTPEALAMEKAFQEQASQDFLSSTQLADQLRSSNIAQSTNLFGLGAQAGMTPLQQQAMGLQNAGSLQGMGLSAQQADLARQAQQQQQSQALYGMGTQSYQLPLALQQQQLGIQSGLFGMGSQAEQLLSGLNAQQLANAGSLFGLSSQAQQLPLSLQGLNQNILTQQLQNAFLPEQQLLTSLSPSLGLQNIISGYDTAQANALTQLGMAGLEAEMGGLSSMSQLESARVNALADALQGLFGATAGADSPVDSLITALLGGS